MESRIVLFPDNGTKPDPIKLNPPDAHSEQFVLAIGEGGRVFVHADREFFARLHAAIGEQL